MLAEIWENFGILNDDPRRCVQDGLETVELEPAGTVEDAVTVVEPVADEAVREHENHFCVREWRIARMQTTTQI